MSQVKASWPVAFRVQYVREVWRRLGLEAAGRPIALYGAGEHTRFLFEAVRGVEGGPVVSVILDDAAAPGQEISGIPVKRPSEVRSSSVTAVVTSSDAHEAILADRARAWAGDVAGAATGAGAGGRHAGPARVVRLYAGLPEGPYERPVKFSGIYGSGIEERNGHFPMDPGSLIFRLPRPSPRPAGAELPLPPPDLRAGYSPWDDAAYLATGAEDVAAMRRLVEDHGGSVAGFRGVLDLGCSTGRQARHWTDAAAGGAAVWGCDVCATSITWAAENLSPPLRFFQSTLRPPLPLPDASIDFLYATSVFTHIRELHDMWLMELRRVVRPGGFVFASIHDEHQWENCRANPGSPLRRRCAELEFSEPLTDDFISYGRGSDPVTFWHSEGVKRRWSFAFDVLEVRQRVIRGQSGVLLRRPRGN